MLNVTQVALRSLVFTEIAVQTPTDACHSRIHLVNWQGNTAQDRTKFGRITSISMGRMNIKKYLRFTDAMGAFCMVRLAKLAKCVIDQ